jgi:D-glycero-D-manno-heptose 1,7-bisphosphate phosphatase
MARMHCIGRRIRLSKILDIQQLQHVVARWRVEGLKIGFTCGCFDLLHAGHVHYLTEARNQCDKLIVAVNSDNSVRSYKDPSRPIITEQHRMALVSALEVVDAVVLMEETRPTQLISTFQPDLYIKGGDYQTSQLRSASFVESYGGKCVIIPVTHQISTTAILTRIKNSVTYATPERGRVLQGSRLVFLDRDGTLIENVPFLNAKTRVKLLPGVGEGLRLLQERGFLLVIVTNQQGIGLGYFSYDDFVAVNSEMLRQLSPYGVMISKFYFCPHPLSEQCACRKPGPGMIERGLAEYQAKASECYLIGDSESDVIAARAAGCKGILIGSEPGGRHHGSFLEAVKEILEHEESTVCAEPAEVC